MASTMPRSHEGVWCLTLVLLLAAAMVYGAPLSHDSSSNQPAAGETDGAMTPSVTSSRVKRQYGDITINEKLVAYLLNKHLPKNCRRVGCGSVDLQKSGRRKRSTTMLRDAMVTRPRDRIMTSELLHIFR